MTARQRIRRGGGRLARQAVPPALKPVLRQTLTGYRAHRATHFVLASGLFDAAWYAAQTGCDPSPEHAVRHYLSHGSAADASPHPLFSNVYMRRRHPHRVGRRNPLLAYLRDAKLRQTARTHPLFDTDLYLATHPEAGTYRSGPTGHYVQRGARAGLRPNDWYTPDPTGEPDGLTDWVRARAAEWTARAEFAVPAWSGEAPPPSDPPTPPAAGTISVVVPASAALRLLSSTVAAVLAQAPAPDELLVVHPAGAAQAVADALGTHGTDARVRLVETVEKAESGLLAAGAAAATGEWLAFCPPAAVWRPGHLAAVLGTALAHGADAAYDVVELVELVPAAAPAAAPAGAVRKAAADVEGVEEHRWASRPTSLERARVDGAVDPAALVVRRAAFEAAGGFDPALHSAAGYDLELRLLTRGTIPLSPHVGVDRPLDRAVATELAIPLRERPRFDPEPLASWRDVVRSRHLVDWPALDPDGAAGTVSAIIPTYADSAMTIRAVECVVAADLPDGIELEVVVVDNGCSVDDSVALDSLPVRFPAVTLRHEPVNRGFALGNNLALPDTRGSIVVFLNNDTEVATGWLAPLVQALEDPAVHGAQSLLVYPSGSIQSAGIAFPACGGVPHVLLQGFPVEDAAGIEDASLSALTAAALAMRRRDVVALRGFDPLFRNGMEDVDLGLRMSALRPGRFTVRGDSVVVHHESRTAGRFRTSLLNRQILLDRYGSDMPGDDVELWRGQRFEVLTHDVGRAVSDDARLSVPVPVLIHHRAGQVREGLPRLRWALKNPAPANEADRWGDTHFIRSLAAALRRAGQEVVIDFRGEFERESGKHDDVVLLLRGVAPYRPAYGQVSLVWLISHPEMFSRSEAQSFDRVFAASAPWARRMSDEWGVRIDPLLQATDPQLFHPDRGRPDTGHPVLFVGSSRRMLRPLVRDAIAEGLALSVYGDHWDDYIPAHYVKARYLTNAHVGEAYRRAGIVLNDHWDDMRADGFLSNRLFDAAASGARVVSDHVEGIEDLFGRSVQVVRSPDELAKIAALPDLDVVFGDDSERRAVAARIHAEHSFDARAQQLLAAVLELRAGLSRSRTGDRARS